MRMTVTFQIASERLAVEKLAEVIGYPGKLVAMGNTPPRNIPPANAWNGTLMLSDADICDTDEVARTILDKYPQIADRVRTLRQISPDIKCRLYFGLRPFSKEFILIFEGETIKRLGELECEISIEYFGDD